MTSVVSFVVHHEPAPQGSKTIMRPKGATRSVAIESSKKVAPFRAAVRAAAVEAFDGVEPFPGPVELLLRCSHQRPRSHYGTGRNEDKLRPAAPHWKTSAPDLDKIVRAVADALTGIAYRDDAQIVMLHAIDRYVGTLQKPRVSIVIRRLPGRKT